MNLLDILLALMNEEQLGWDILFIRTTGTVGHLFIILLDREVPERHLVVRTGRGKNGIFGWVPLDGRNGGSVPAKRRHRSRI